MMAAFSGQLLGAKPIVIAHKDISPDVVKQLDLQQVFLGKKTSWPGGQTIQFAVLSNGPVHESFLEEKIRKQPSQFSQYWKTAVFSGRGKMPPEVESEAEMVKFVSETPGAIGYVSSEYASASDLSMVSSVAD